jgi:hypothetical protein
LRDEAAAHAIPAERPTSRDLLGVAIINVATGM